ncbi:MAG: nicotinate phosphoribosyltransferase [Fastidiosipilaceae bacterium]|jgi:nicotinate phosphoribosyltransferase|nr:nicotinate phosphoribosyltransferase [Clostridiaceae bacterium]
MSWNERTNLSMLTDYYELTMSQSYMDQGVGDKIAYFDLYFRHVPESGGYAIMAGVEQMVDYLQALKFDKKNIDYLRSTGDFSEEFLDYLANFEFVCDVWAIPEGTPVFPNEPIVKVRGPLIQAQMIETMLLLTVNHQSLIATKSSRIVRAAAGRPVMEFGARRAQGYDASVLGARAAYIGGAAGTSCTICGEQFDIPLSGTMAHSFVLMFDSEFDAFKAYAETYPDNTVLLVDTYNTLKSGIPNAIRINKEILEPIGKRVKGVRIDSGDLNYLSIEARRLLDEAGMEDCVIIASNSLDEYLIETLLMQGSKIDAFGVGERLITSRAEPVFGGVYKLSGVEEDGKVIPKMKVSDNFGKITTPCNKEVWRFYNKDTNQALADLVTIAGEDLSQTETYEIFHPIHTWKRKVLSNYEVKQLLQPVFVGGKCVYETKSIEEIKAFCMQQQTTLWDSVRRFENPQVYYVDLSYDLWSTKQQLLKEHGMGMQEMMHPPRR